MLAEVADESRNPLVLPILKQGDCPLDITPLQAGFCRR
jgi:hypothetical protein